MRCCYLLSLALIISPMIYSGEVSTVKAINFIGNTDLSKENVLKDYPLRIGQSVDVGTTRSLIQDWCDQKKKELKNYEVSCSPFAFGGELGDIFSVVIVQNPQGLTKQYISHNCNQFVFLKQSLIKYFLEYNELSYNAYKRNVVKGSTSTEYISEQKVLDYKWGEEISELHAFSLRASQFVPKERHHLYTVLKYSCNDNDRVAAAELLNWAKNPKESIQEVYPYIQDHNEGVRNNVGRFIASFAEELKDSPELANLILAQACSQLKSANFYDKNKALAMIGRLVEALPTIKKTFKENYPTTVQYLEYLSENSQSPALGGSAKFILENI